MILCYISTQTRKQKSLYYLDNTASNACTCTRSNYFFAGLQPIAPVTSMTTSSFFSTQASRDATVLTTGENTFLPYQKFSWKFTVLDLDQVIAQGSIKIEKNRDSFLVVKAIWCAFVFHNHWSCAFQKAIAFLTRGWLHKIMVFLKRGLVLCCQSWSLQKNNFVCILIRTESDVIT